MNLEQAKDILFKTHLAALESGTRAHGYVLQSGPGVGKSDSIPQTAERLCLHLQQPVAVSLHMLAEVTGPDIRGFLMPVRVEGSIPRAVFLDPTWFPTVDNCWVVEPTSAARAVRSAARVGDKVRSSVRPEDNQDRAGIRWHRPGTWEEELPVVGIEFLDEWGQADEDVRKAAAPLIHQGNVGTCTLPITWRVVAAQNRPGDRSGVQRELMHVVNRRALLDIDPDLTCWLNWADDQPDGRRPHHLTRAFARKQPGIVFRNTLPDSTDPYCTARTLCMMDRDIRVLQTQEDVDHDRLPMSDLARELCASFIGKGSAAQFFTHLHFSEELPDLEDIIQDPTGAKVPPGKDAQMICAYMLADVINDDTAKPVFRYITRLHREMQIMAVGVITGKSDVALAEASASLAQLRRTKALVVLPEYTDWLMRHKDTLIASQM